MTNPTQRAIAQAIQPERDTQPMPVSVAFKTATGYNEIDGVRYPALASVVAGDWCAVEYIGNQILIRGPVIRTTDTVTVDRLVHAVGTSAQTGFNNTAAQMSGCSVTFTADASRKYRTIVHLPRVDQITLAGFVYLIIGDASATITNGSVITLSAAASGSVTTESIETGLSGSVTRVGWLRTTSGTANTVTGYLPIISVEDVGPA